LKNINVSPGISLIFIITIFLFMVNFSSANDLFPQKNEEKTDKEYSDWSFSFFLAAAFGGPADNIGTQMRRPGIHDSYNNSTEGLIFHSLSNIHPQSWMIQLDYRMIQRVGVGLLYSNSVIDEVSMQLGASASPHNIISFGNSVKTISLLISIYLNDNIVFGLGPTYNMTDSPSSANEIGFLAHLNIRVPLNDRFSVNGILQYRYVGITEIGPFSLETADELPPPTVTSNTFIFPETQINYSHFFIGLGMSIYFVQK